MAALLAALLLLAPSARADDKAPPPPEVHGKAVMSVQGCSEKQSHTMSVNVPKAVEAVQGCLHDLNPKLAEKILKSYANFEYRCSDTPSAEGGDTQRAGGKTVITMAFKTTLRQYDFDARLFHEMIHAVDGDYSLVGDRKAHSQAGNPDPVYGCQLACFPSGIEEKETEMYLKAGSGVPEAKGYDPKKYMDPGAAYIMDDKSHLWAAQTYAGICAAGKPFHAEKHLDQACLAQKMVNGCPKADDKGFCDSDAADDTAYCRLRCGGKDTSAAVDAAMKSSAEIIAALKDRKGLSGESASLLKQLKADKSLEACNK